MSTTISARWSQAALNTPLAKGMMSFRAVSVLMFSFITTRLGVNMLSSNETTECEYEKPLGFAFSAVILAMYVAVTMASAGEWVYENVLSWVSDAVLFVPGTFFVIAATPTSLYGGIASEDCSVQHSGIALTFLLLGELLTSGTFIKMAVTMGFGRSALNSALFIVGFFLYLMFIELVASEMRS